MIGHHSHVLRSRVVYGQLFIHCNDPSAKDGFHRSALAVPRFRYQSHQNHKTRIYSNLWIPYNLSIMAPTSLADLVSSLPSDESWGPTITKDALVDGVPYAPYSKGDKLGRMADWTSEGKDGRDGRGGRQQYQRNYRGTFMTLLSCVFESNRMLMITRSASIRSRNFKPFCRPGR